MNLKRISIALALSLASAIAQPIVKDATTSVYAVVTDPMSLSFAADGTQAHLLTSTDDQQKAQKA